MRKQVILAMREQKRLHVISELDAGRVTGREAAEFMGVSLRQARKCRKIRPSCAAMGTVFQFEAKTG